MIALRICWGQSDQGRMRSLRPMPHREHRWMGVRSDPALLSRDSVL